MTPSTVGAAILGPGNVGASLVLKLIESNAIDLRLVAGVDEDSPGLRLAAARGVEVSSDGADAILRRDDVEIVFDSATAEAHLEHAPHFEDAGKRTIDLTGAARGLPVIPLIDLEGHLTQLDLSLVSSAGQVAVPFVWAVDQVADVEYAEIVATISSASAGRAARQGIDQLTEATADAVIAVGGATTSRALIFLGPGDSESVMRTTVYAQVRNLDLAREISASVQSMATRMAVELPRCHLTTCEVEGREVTVRVEIGDAGSSSAELSSLAPITNAAVRVGEAVARRLFEARS